MHVIGTAGHVDHGKSTLIAALTGTHPDRLKEEQEREMTIDLGFGWLTLPGGEEIGIVDVPGHRDFIENMLAGVGGIDAALLVIAADEGVMPQTREHLAILDLLQVKKTLVVLTKADLIEDPAWFDLLEADIRALLQPTALKDAPMVRVSARTRQGLPDLLQALDLLLRDQPARPDLGRPRLPIDRIFSMSGFGTVVTGTLSDGQLAVGDEVELLPSGLTGRIRGLQTHKQKEDRAVPGSRTAVNITGLELELVHRGQVVTHPGQYRATQRMDVHFRLLADASAPLKHHSEVKLFLGTAEVVADVRLLGVESLNPGETGWLQLELHAPVLAVRGDRFILRRPSPGETLGGGSVVEPQPKKRHRRFDPATIAALETLAQGSPAEMLLQTALTLGPATRKDLFTRARLAEPAALSALEELLGDGQLVALEDLVIPAAHLAVLQQALTQALGAYHQTYPLRRGMPREELKSRLKLQPRLFTLLLPRLAAQGILVENPKWVALPDHSVRYSPFQQVKVDELMKHFTAAPFAPPVVKECQALVGEDVLTAMLESGDLLAVSSEVVFRSGDFETMLVKLRQLMTQKGQVTLAEVRDLLQTSRKYIQPFLEYLDSINVTVREGDFRRLKK